MTIQEDREQARTLLNANVVIEAGAGTGKTTLLIERLCLALLGQGISAPRLVALTFTEKAAAEIKTRLLTKLQTVLKAVREKTDEPILDLLQSTFQVPTETIIQRAELALAQLDRSQIGTIHSFCADILKQYPLEAGLTPNAEIDTGTKAQYILETHWNRFLDEQLGAQATQPTRWKEILQRVTLTQLYECVQTMCSGKIQHFNYTAQKDLLITICKDRAKQATALSQAFLDGKKKPRTLERVLQQAALRFEQAAQWLTTGQLPTAAEETITISSAAPKDWDPESVEQAKALCRFAEQADPFVQQGMLQIYDLLSPVVARVRAQYAAEGILSFDDLIIKTRDLLQHNLLVRRLLKEQYDAFYIDEFQDTDPAQGELLLFLAEQKGHGVTTWQDVQLTPGKLCVVGDPKQSIYRFRGADITAYELFTGLILKQGGKKAYLRQNFRSVGNIIKVVNQVCGTVMQEKVAFQPKYEPIFTTKPTQQPATQLVLINPCEAKADADDYRHNQAEWVARWIAQNVGTLTLSNGKKLTYQDIVILSRASTTLSPYIEALRRHVIPFNVEEDRNFYSRQELADFLNLLRVLEDPQNKIALVGVLRSPFGTLTDEEIYQLAQNQELDFLRPSRHPKAQRLYLQLQQWHAQVGRIALTTWIQNLLESSFLQEACAQAYQGQSSIAYLAKWAELVSGYALQMPVTLGQFLARVDRLLKQEITHLSAAPVEEVGEAVNVMSVHKSKGLEFPVVIWVDISKKEVQTSSMRPNHLYSWQYNLHGLRVGKYADINFAWLEEQQREHARCEEIRLLYVALTRAREKLILVGNERSDRGTVAAVFQSCQSHPILQKQQIAYINPTEFIYEHAQPEQKVSLQWDINAWHQAYTKRQTSYTQASQQTAVLPPSKQTEHRMPADARAMQVGSWVHAALQRHVYYPKETITQLLQATCYLGDKALFAQAEDLLNSFWQSEAFAQLEKMDILGAELPFSFHKGDGVVSGVIDLLLKETDGTIWVVDYKTDDIEPGTETQHAAQYLPQLTVYTQAATRLYPAAQVQSAVVFVRTGKIVKMPAHS